MPRGTRREAAWFCRPWPRGWFTVPIKNLPFPFAFGFPSPSSGRWTYSFVDCFGHRLFNLSNHDALVAFIGGDEEQRKRLL
jgi:hypothetical protein